jgi:hypothetical protein
MGGGSKSSQESKQTTTSIQKDTTSTGGGIVVGAEGLYAAQSAQSGAVAEGGAGVAGNENTVENISGLKIGNNSTIRLTALDDNTQSILDQAFTIVSANANNMMTLAAGRDANKPLADESTATGAQTAQIKTTLSGLTGLFTPARIGVGLAVIGLIWFLSKKKGVK